MTKLRWLRFSAALLVSPGLPACGSSAVSSSFVHNDGGAGGRGDGGVAPHLDAMSHTLPGSDGSTMAGVLTISPTNPMLMVTNASAPPTETFKASYVPSTGGAATIVAPAWTLSNYSVATIDATGKLTPAGTVAATIVVTASYQGLTASTNITIEVSLTTSLGNVTLPDGTVISEDATAISSADMTALNGTPLADAGAAVSPLIYPYDQTVFPLGLVAPVVQWNAGSVAPSDFKLTIDTAGFQWNGFGHIGNPQALLAAIPQNIWDGALTSATASTTGTAAVTLSLVTAAAGVAYGPSVTHLIIAPGSLTGVIYYESYSSDPLPSDGGAAPPDGGWDGGETDFGLWSVRPGSTTPPSHVQPGCVLCHSVSASGNTLTASTDDQNGPTNGANTGVFRIEADGGYTHLATAPLALPYTENSARGLGWATVSPDGRLVMRSITQYWGGDTLLAWAVPSEPLVANGAVQPLSTPMTVNGDLDMFVPEYSPDGKHLVYVTSQGGVDAGVPGTPSQSIGVLDIATTYNDAGPDAASYGTVALTNARTVYDSTMVAAVDGGGANVFTKVPTFLPDSETIVFEETLSAVGICNHMLPDYINNSETVYIDGELAMLQSAASGSYARVPMTNANTGYDPNAATHNYEPKPLPVQVGGYYWVVFSSTRADAYPGLSYPKKLWVTAISPGAGGKDTSHPAFTLVNQAIVHNQKSQRAYWALAPCQGTGATCQSTNDCCMGSCFPGPDAGSGLMCGTPTAAACVPSGGRCQVGGSSACCGAADGVACIGTLNGSGTCSAPAPPP